MKVAQLWPNEWQRSHCGAVLAELGGNQPCWVLGKALHREMSNCKHSDTELSKGAPKKICWPLGVSEFMHYES